MEVVKHTFLEKFSCLADECPNTCCQQWQIEVDEATWAAWNREPEERRHALVTAVSTLPSPGGERKLVLKKRNDGFCPLLDDRALCSVQQQCGHDLLPKVCREYPRQEMDYGGRRVQSIKHSCPQTVRLLLEEHRRRPRELLVWVDEGGAAAPGDDGLGLQRLEPMLLQVIEETDMPLGVRLYWVYEVLDVLAEAHLADRLDAALVRKQCKVTEKGINKALKALAAKRSKGALRPNPAQTGQLWEALFVGLWPRLELVFGDRLMDSPTFQYLLTRLEAHKGDAPIDAGQYKVTGNRVMKAAKSLPSRYRATLTGYLTLRLVDSGFAHLSDLVANARVFHGNVLLLAVIELLLWCRMELGELDDDVFVDIVHRVERRLGNNRPIFQLLKAFPQELGLHAGQQMALMLG